MGFPIRMLHLGWKVFMLLLLIVYPTKAQQFSKTLYNYSQRDGLPSDAIIQTVKDGSGFTWVLTTNGLARFDGNRFESLRYNSQLPNSVPSGGVKSLEIDSENRLWLIQGNSVSRASKDGLSFQHFPFPADFPIQQINEGLFLTNNNEVWIGAMGDFVVLNLKTKEYRLSGWRTFYNTSINKFSNIISGISIIQKSKNEIWVLATNGLFSYNLKSQQFQYYPCDLVSTFQGIKLYQFDGVNLWFGSYNNGIISYDCIKNNWRSYLLPADFLDAQKLQSVYALTPISKSAFIAISRKDLLLFDIPTGTFYAIPLNDAKGKKLAFELSSLTFEKQSKRLWLSTISGLYRSLDAPLFTFNKLNEEPNDKFFNLFFEANENEGYIAGSVYTDELFQVKSNNLSPINLDKLPIDFVSSMKKDKQGRIWVCMRNEVLVRDEKTIKWKKLDLPPSPVNSKNRVFWEVAFASNGKAYLCSWTDGILEINADLSFHRFLPLHAGKGDARFLGIFIHENTLWISTETNGVCEFNLSTQKENWIRAQLKDAIALPGYPINDMQLDSNGKIWFCTASNGLACYNPISNKMQQYGAQQGLKSDITYWCAQDGSGNLWVAGPGMIHLYDSNTDKFIAYGEEQGWPNQEMFKPARMKNGELFFGTKNGYYTLLNSPFHQKTIAPKLYIHQVFQGDSLFSNTLKIKLQYPSNNISISYGAIDYTVPNRLRFQYSISPDTLWKETTGNLLSFAELKPGNYTIKLRASNGNENWSNPVVYSFEVLAPFWEKAWFIVLIISIVAFIILLIVRNKLHAEKAKAQLKQRIAETEMAALRAQMSPHFIFNCLNSIDNLIQQNDTQNAAKYLQRFAKMIRDVLEHSRSKEIPFRKDWETLKIYLELEQLRQDGKINLRFEASQELISGDYRVPPLLIQPYIENALHHGLLHKIEGEKRLFVSAYLSNEMLVYWIEDNGIGREAAGKIKASQFKSRPSLGMQLSAQRITLYDALQGKGTIEIIDLKSETGAACGTKVIVNLQT